MEPNATWLRQTTIWYSMFFIIIYKNAKKWKAQEKTKIYIFICWIQILGSDSESNSHGWPSVYTSNPIMQ